MLIKIIAEEEIREAYNRIYYGCRDKGIFTKYVIELYDVLNDNYQYTEEIQTTIKQLKSIYSMYDWQVGIYNNSGCKIIIPNFQTVVDEIVEFMKSRGYVLITQKVENSIVGDEVLMWQNLYFVPKNQTDITDELSGYNVFYHISPLTLLP